MNGAVVNPDLLSELRASAVNKSEIENLPGYIEMLFEGNTDLWSAQPLSWNERIRCQFKQM
jgi:hypothetical protein